MKKTIAVTFAIVSLATAGVLLAGCGSKEKKTEVTVFAAKSLNGVMDELCEKYNSEHPNVTFQTNYDSSGTLMTQIKEGAKCNIFFSAGVSQMDRGRKPAGSSEQSGMPCYMERQRYQSNRFFQSFSCKEHGTGRSDRSGWTVYQKSTDQCGHGRLRVHRSRSADR